MSKGYVYILSNPAMPGLLKIGKSVHGGKQRAGQLYQTGIPAPFHLEFEILCEYPEEAEASAHQSLGGHRVRSGREFFDAPLSDAIAAVTAAALSEYAFALVSVDELWALSRLSIFAKRANVSLDEAASLLHHMSDFSVFSAKCAKINSEADYRAGVAAGTIKPAGFIYK